MYFSPLLLWEMPLQCHKGYHNSAIPCDESTALCTVVIWWAKMYEKEISNLSDAASHHPASTLRPPCVGNGNTECCLGCGLLISATHISTQPAGSAVSLSEVNGSTITVFFPMDIIPSLHLTYLNKTCRNTWFSKADLTTVMSEARMKKPVADLASS